MQLVPAGFRLGDDPLQVFEAAIDEIDALPADGQPRPAVDPRAPAVKVRDHRPGGVVDGLGQLANALDREGSRFRVENAEIDVRPRLSASAGMRPPSTTALTPGIAPSRFASDDTSSRCSGESCFTFEVSCDTGGATQLTASIIVLRNHPYTAQRYLRCYGTRCRSAGGAGTLSSPPEGRSAG